MITNSPYHQGVNDVASDKALHKMEGELAEKQVGTIQVKQASITKLDLDQRNLPVSPATEKLGHITSYSLNDYFLARGFASLHVSGVGTLGSTGYMTSGDYQQVEGYKAVIDWLNGRTKAYTDHTRSLEVKADWPNGKVATTGLSYLGTMSNALATTGVDGLEVIIAEAGISSWYDYYRENGLVTSPGGYPGEDLDSLTALTYSKSLQAGDFLRNKAAYEKDWLPSVLPWTAPAVTTINTGMTAIICSTLIGSCEVVYPRLTGLECQANPCLEYVPCPT